MSNRTKHNFLQMIKSMENDLDMGYDYLIENMLLQYYLSCFNSYMGFFTKASSYSFIKKVITNLSSHFFTYYSIVKKGVQWK